MTTHSFVIIFSGLLIVLWVYSAVSKLADFVKFRHSMLAQIFPRWMSKILLYLLPLTELSIAVLLFIPGTRLLGMYASLVLMFMFTLYVGGAVFRVYDRYPCACGGLFTKLGWHQHFKVNIGLTVVALIGVLLMEL